MLSLFFGLFLFTVPPQYGLPEGATIIETRPLVSNAHQNRALVLWMLNPKRNPREPADEVYTCPEYTRGHYYSGPTRVSLVDLKTNKIINTVNVKASDGEDGDFDLPYKIARGYYYQIVKGNAKEAKPIILALKDFNGDGKAHEFALYDAAGCMGLETALIGYSERQDKVIQYHIVLTTKEKTTAKTETLWWVDYLFSKQANKNGVWKYEIDYRGRGGALDQYEIRYNAKQERFEGTLTFKE
ncbi:MAG: hypothetical protein JNM09_12750 [Blastocatellia bacterium]|nr:hypothetical protein [Blastocatellia bacterium]